jgi:DNA (cytosine-5)-methyltransferase 1
MLMRTKPKALDLFCCGGGAGMGLHQAGFEVVGVDIDPQPRYPFAFIQADALTYPLEGFDFIWASPPCQRFTKASKLQGNTHPDLIAPMRERLTAAGVPWAIENVPGAPLLNPIELCGQMFGLELYRHRLFECSFPVEAPHHPEHRRPQVKMGRPPKPGEIIQVVGHFSNVPQGQKAMGIDWLSQDKLREAIPPAYAKFIGAAALAHLRHPQHVGARELSI